MTKEETISNLKAYLDGDTAIGNIIPLRSVLESAIKYLESSLPSNLDEVAEKEIERFCSDMLNVDIIWAEMPLTKRFGLQMAKFGAEWMAGQGDAIATRLVIDSEGKVNLNFAIGDITDENCKPKYHAGQDVIVQIRKN